MPIPDKGFFDTKQPTDSVVSAKRRKDEMRAEAEEQAKHAQEAELRRQQREAAENAQAQANEEAFVNRVSSGVTREHLLNRIRQMRAEAEPKPPPPPQPLTELQRKQFEAEQEVGRQNVAKAQAEWDANQALRAKIAAEQAAREGTLTPVVHPNPTIEERFPVNQSTIDKPK